MPRCQRASRVRVPGFRSRRHRAASHSQLGGPIAGLPPAEAVPRPVAKPRFPALFAPNQFTPISRLAVRATSRNRTLSITCCDGATVMAFTTLPSGTMVLATCTARSAATELLARPLSTIWPLLLPTRMPLLPVLDWIFCCRLPVSIATSTSRMPICLHRTIEQDDVGGAGAACPGCRSC